MSNYSEQLNKKSFTNFDFFTTASYPPIPFAEYWFFLLIPLNKPARCLILHRILDPISYVMRRFNYCMWNNDGTPMKNGHCKVTINTKNREFNVRGKVNCSLWEDDGNIHLTGHMPDNNKIDLTTNLGSSVKEVSWNPKVVCRMYESGLSNSLNLDQLVSKSIGRLYNIHSKYNDSVSGEKGYCYFERIQLSSVEVKLLDWDFILAIFNDGTFFLHWESPFFKFVRGVYIDTASGKVSINPQATVRINGNQKIIECDGDSHIYLKAKILKPVQSIPFNCGSLEAIYNQAVGKVDSFIIDGRDSNKTGIVYSDWVKGYKLR